MPNTDPPRNRAATHARRTSLRRDRPRPAEPLRRALRSRDFAHAALLALAFVLVCGSLAAWARQRPLIAVGRVLDHTRVARVSTTVLDPDATEAERRIARNQTPRVWEANLEHIDAIVRSLRELPRTVSGAASARDINEDIRTLFNLTDQRLQALRAEAPTGEPSSAWLARVDALRTELLSRPVVARDVWQTVSQENWRRPIELRLGEQILTTRATPQSVANAADPAQLRDLMTQAATAAGFSGPLLDIVVARLTHVPHGRNAPLPTFKPNDALTQAREEQAAADVPPVYRPIIAGQIIYQRGETLSQQRLDDTRAEIRAYLAQHPAAAWTDHAAAFAGVAAVTLGLTAYLALFAPRVRRNPLRMAAIAALLALAFATAVVSTVVQPAGLALFATSTTTLIAILLSIVYDRRIGTALAAILTLLICFALRAHVTLAITTLTGVAVAAWNLAEIRDRRSLIRTSLLTASALAAVMLATGMADRPKVPQALPELLWDAAMAGGAGILAGGITMFILPSIERLFDVTTGMTLMELRDPRHTLLRQLQQRAPGTYNHSLNVATIAEAAADAIGADALLTYVGALYHDIGKMNKPEYFVENQSGGPNRHDRLSPAMSLLVIVGHVKDGLEMAREFSLPRPIQHFIEAHHGTTLVEYFYHRARAQAQAAGDDDADQPQEITYRYPGPKPRTREVAIVMLADAVEGATRSLSEPTPSRIEALVQDLANKRLTDGQFDECDLTLKDLKIICDSISKTVASIYHGRIAYPGPAKRADGSERRA